MLLQTVHNILTIFSTRCLVKIIFITSRLFSNSDILFNVIVDGFFVSSFCL